VTIEFRKGNGFLGSAELETSVANAEILPEAPEAWTNDLYTFYKFDFYNDQICTVKINGGDAIYLRAGQGFNSDIGDADIISFKIVEDNITYNWFGCY
jgi:hypothetical protein